MKTASRFWSGVPRVVLAGVILASAGCVPGAAWLPDSSGLVYTSQKGELRLFDVAAGKVQVVAKTDTQTIWPAVSPDGQRFAVARVQKHHVAGVGFEAGVVNRRHGRMGLQLLGESRAIGLLDAETRIERAEAA